MKPNIHTMKRYLFLLLLAVLATACKPVKPGNTVRAVYHWKTTYNPTQYELQWLRDHQVTRLYLRVFDVDVHESETAAPIATTRFLQPLPDSMEIVPVVYITNEALERYCYYSWVGELCYKIADRVIKMAECNGFELKEIQVDCDWTERTEDSYYRFCKKMQEYLNQQGIRFSSTVRLHQVNSDLDELAADSKVLMLYNTGNLRSWETRNSILDYSDVEPYLRRLTPERMKTMGVAWPVFGWGVAFDTAGHFSHLVNSSTLADSLGWGSDLRIEWGEMAEMRRVWEKLPTSGGDHVTVLYHLDSINLSKYTYDEIEEIYSR